MSLSKNFFSRHLSPDKTRKSHLDFLWLIVDDGSTDKTKEVVSAWIEEKQFPIIYYHQENGGKHRAINRGLNMAQGYAFFIVDSDDYLTDNAIETILDQLHEIKGRKGFGGVCGMKAYPDNKRVAKGSQFDVIECTSCDFWYKHKINGDMAEVYYTDILRKYPFPEIKGENFCPEALVWFQISNSGYKMRFFNDSIYICEYQPDGLSAKSLRLRIESPLASMMTYSVMASAPVTKKRKIELSINYWRFYFHSGRMHIPETYQKPSRIYSFLGFLFYLFDGFYVTE